ncbi:MAG: BtpA/SgcQ family protein [Bacteroidetes bacterium]|nr:MAG: BtpA/SgcQ family protein [Bacteroidota bacterium]
MKLNKKIIGMVHVAALPGTPKSRMKTDAIISEALRETLILTEGGVDAVMIENMHDRPYLNRNAGPEIVAAITAVAVEIRRAFQIPLGIQVLAGANQEALAIALASGFDFIRAEGFVFGHLADEGWMNSDAGELLRYRKQIGAGHIKIFTDIKKKHSSNFITSDVSVAETAKAAEFFLSDGIIVTGTATGEKASVEEVKSVKMAVQIPVIIGSGIDVENIQDYWDFADAFIVGSSLKKDGNWENEVDRNRVKRLMDEVKRLRGTNQNLLKFV